MSGPRNEGSPVAGHEDQSIRRLGEQVRALLRSNDLLRRLEPGPILRAATGASVPLGYGSLNRFELSGDARVQLPAISPAWVGVPLYVTKVSGTGVATIIGAGGATVDRSASGVQRTEPGLSTLVSDGLSWFSVGGEDGDASDVTVATGVFPPAAAFRLPNTFNPLGLWYFDQSLSDSSGNGFNLQVEAGAEHYAVIFPGVMGGMLGGASGTFCRLICTGVASATMLGVKGDISVEMIVTQDERPSPVLAGPWVSYAGAGGLEVDNALWSYFTNIDNGPEWYQEYNASVPSTLGLTKHVSPPVASRPILHGARRASGIIQFFQDGKPYGTLTGTGLTLPTGGSASEFRVGGSQAGTQAPRFLCSSLKVVATGLSNAAFLADYNASLGLYYGART